MTRYFVCFFALALALCAGDISGKWSAKVPMRDGLVPIAIVLKTDGAKVTGRVGSDQGEAEIVNGKLEGDDLSFELLTNSARYVVKGKVAADGIRFNAQREGSERAIEFTATRAE